jgi:hypothetical protein
MMDSFILYELRKIILLWASCNMKQTYWQKQLLHHIPMLPAIIKNFMTLFWGQFKHFLAHSHVQYKTELSGALAFGRDKIVILDLYIAS